jgi:hypothetical protein
MAELQRSQLWRHRPQDWREIDGFSASLACGHQTPAYAPDGHPYGRPQAGSYVTCRPCQGQRRVTGCTRVPRPPEELPGANGGSR